MPWTFDEINDRTGFAAGDRFENDDEVREYFALDTLAPNLYGYPWDTDDDDEERWSWVNQDDLDDMAQAVIDHHWWYSER